MVLTLTGAASRTHPHQDLVRFFDFLFGTLAPSLRASDKPIAMACFRLITFLPERPLFSVPALRFFIARLTFFAAALEYLGFFVVLAIFRNP